MTRDWVANELFRRVEGSGKTMGQYIRSVLKWEGLILGARKEEIAKLVDVHVNFKDELRECC